jgi:predicted O-methyltransferase YrrM
MKNLFPIKSQTSTGDKQVLLSVIDSLQDEYNYLEIGSFLGGSLTPFLDDTKCKLILSIDDREKIQPDERGLKFDYQSITTEMMMQNIVSYGFDTSKLLTFDGSIESYKSDNTKFDLVFIDGEHTDVACFRDFVYAFRLLKEDAICLFHDSQIVYKGIQTCLIYLDVNRIDYQFVKVLDTDMSIILLGAMKDLDFSNKFTMEDPQIFFEKSEEYRVKTLIENNSKENKISKIKI